MLAAAASRKAPSASAGASKPEHGRASPDEPRDGCIARRGLRSEVNEAADERERERPRGAFDPLDPAARQAAQLAPPPTVTAAAPVDAAPAADVAPRARVSMEELLPQLVRRIAWAGDRRRGSVQMELGAGKHAGTIVTVHADDGRVRVELQGADTEELRSRIDARLARKGIDVESVT